MAIRLRISRTTHSAMYPIEYQKRTTCAVSTQRAPPFRGSCAANRMKSAQASGRLMRRFTKTAIAKADCAAVRKNLALLA